jgi:hypothetical protein
LRSLCQETPETPTKTKTKTQDPSKTKTRDKQQASHEHGIGFLCPPWPPCLGFMVSVACWRPPPAVRRAVRVLVLSSELRCPGSRVARLWSRCLGCSRPVRKRLGRRPAAAAVAVVAVGRRGSRRRCWGIGGGLQAHGQKCFEFADYADELERPLTQGAGGYGRRKRRAPRACVASLYGPAGITSVSAPHLLSCSVDLPIMVFDTPRAPNRGKDSFAVCFKPQKGLGDSFYGPAAPCWCQARGSAKAYLAGVVRADGGKFFRYD